MNTQSPGSQEGSSDVDLYVIVTSPMASFRDLLADLEMDSAFPCCFLWVPDASSAGLVEPIVEFRIDFGL